MFLGANLLPAVDFSRLEEVLVLRAPKVVTGLVPRSAPVPARVEERQP